MRSAQAVNELRDLAANRASQVVDPRQRRYISTTDTVSQSTAAAKVENASPPATPETPAP